MRTVLWRGLRAHARRMTATFMAVLCAVAFIAGTFIFSDTAQAGFYDTYARLARNVDVSVRPPVVDKNADHPAELTAAQVARVRSTPGIGAVDARMQEPLPLIGRDGQVITNFGQAGVVISSDAPATLRSYDLTGAVPAAGQALVDKDTAAHQHWHIGDQITVVDRDGQRRSLSISGLIDFGVSKQYSGRSVVGLPAAEITDLTGQTGYIEVAASASAGVSEATLTARVRAELGRRPQIVTGDQRRTELANDAVSVASQFQFILLIFGVISLIVAAFVIYNTFAILLAQRVRDTALLRCVGATRRQVFATAIIEAASIGFTAAIVGVAVGAAAAYGLIKLLNGVANAGIPASGVHVGLSSVIIGVVVGVTVTIAAALIPAVRATRVTAMTAMRDNAIGRVSRGRSIVRGVFAAVLVALGAAVTYLGTRNSEPRTGTFVVVGGGVLAFLGLLVAAPLFVGPVMTLLGAAPVRLFGTPARLAVANSRRNPGRTALTTATLMIGIGLMALFSVVLGSVRETAAEQLGTHYPVDYVMTPISRVPDQQGLIPTSYADALRQMPQFAAVGEIRDAKATIAGRQGVIETIDPAALGSIASPELTSGRLSDLTTGTVVLSANWPGRPHVGDRVTLQVAGRTTQLTVVGTSRLGIPGGEGTDALVSWTQFRQLSDVGDDAAVIAKAASGVGPVASRDALNSLTTAYPLVYVNSIADLRSSLDSTVNGLLALFAGLLGTAVLISLFGIANTLALSVQERTRESATVRALGLTRGQLRSTLLFEALLMGLVGAIVGIGFGLIYGRLLVKTAFAAIGPTVIVPWSWVVGLIVLAGVAATLAAVMPARRAANAAPVAAMAQA